MEKKRRWRERCMYKQKEEGTLGLGSLACHPSIHSQNKLMKRNKNMEGKKGEKKKQKVNEGTFV